MKTYESRNIRDVVRKQGIIFQLIYNITHNLIITSTY